MCAIAGCIGMNLSEENVKKMLDSMKRRGPDGEGIFQRKDVTLLHRRLAIIDPIGGKQPMTLAWNKEEYTIVYNGELYNTEEIRKELQHCGHSFCEHSDTEIVLHSFAQWGTSCLERLNGIFAFAVYEHISGKIILCRDRIGVKPLFYAMTENGLIFASEIKTILCSGKVKPQLDQVGASQIILLGPGRIPGSGVLHGIHEIEPGCFGEFCSGQMKTTRYWKLTDHPHVDCFEDTAAKVRELVIDSIKRQMISDVPIGTFLSGGLDSSIISAVCAGEFRERGESLDTFSVDYEHNSEYFIPGKFQPNSDTEYIGIMADCLRSNHHQTILTAENLVSALEDATIARDLPGMADVDFSLLLFCGEIRQYVKVALSGECADEIFGGYPWYRDPEIRTQAGFPWSQTTSQRALLMSKTINGVNAEEFVMDVYRDTCQNSDILPENSPQERRMKEMVNLNFRWFMQTLLHRKDHMSMFSGLEVRVPFCDYRIAEYLYSVPWEYKDYHGREKGLLRYAVRDLLPEQIVNRKKSPYPKTFDPNYEKLVTAQLNGILQSKDDPLFELIDRHRLTEFLRQEGEWPWYGQLMRRAQTIAYFLQISFWLKHYHIELMF